MSDGGDERRRLERELVATRFLLKETVRRASLAEGQLARLTGSVRFRLGQALAETGRSPAGLVRLPLELARLLAGAAEAVPAPEPVPKTASEAGRIRLLVAGHDLRFFEPIERALEASGKVVVRRDPWSSEHEHEERSSLEALAWADVVVAEWCLGNAVWYSQRLRSDQRLLVRFHLRERASRYPQRVDWSSVDRVVFVGPHILTEAVNLLGVPASKAVFIPNLVEVPRFALPKRPGSEHTLGMLGLVPMRKRLDRTLDLFERLWREDPAWRLRIKGARPEAVGWVWRRQDERAWYDALFSRIESAEWGARVAFDPPGPDVPEWLSGIEFLAAPSDFESFHVAVGEAMAAGTFPLVWDWHAAEQLWPDEVLVRDSTEAAALIERLRRDPNLASVRGRLLSWVTGRYGPAEVGGAWLDLLEAGG